MKERFALVPLSPSVIKSVVTRLRCGTQNHSGESKIRIRAATIITPDIKSDVDMRDSPCCETPALWSTEPVRCK